MHCWGEKEKTSVKEAKDDKCEPQRQLIYCPNPNPEAHRQRDYENNPQDQDILSVQCLCFLQSMEGFPWFCRAQEQMVLHHGSAELRHWLCSSQQAPGSSRTALASGSPWFLTHTATALSRTPEIRPKSSVGTQWEWQRSILTC